MIKINSKSQKRHKKILKLTKGFIGSHSKLFKISNQENIKSMIYSYRNRKIKKRNLTKLWTKKINNKIKETKFKNYNTFANILKKNKIILNKKILSKILEQEPLGTQIFEKIQI